MFVIDSQQIFDEFNTENIPKQIQYSNFQIYIQDLLMKLVEKQDINRRNILKAAELAKKARILEHNLNIL